MDIMTQQTASDVFSLRNEIKANLAEMLNSKPVSQEQNRHVQENLAKALDISRNIMRLERDNEWNVRAFGWTVIDCIKLAMKENRRDEAKRLFLELDRYSIPASEESLIKALTKYRHILMENRPDPAGSNELAAAAALNSRGEHLEACRLYQKVIHHFSHDESVNVSYGWAISKALKVMSDEEKPLLGPFMDLLRCYAKLNIFDAMKRAYRLCQFHEDDGVTGRSDEKDSLIILHTTVLNYATKMAKKQAFPGFIPFVKWWNLENLCNSDYEKYTPQGSDKIYYSLAEKVIKALYQTAKTIENVDDITFALNFIESSINRFPDNIWLIYYSSRLNVKLGRHDVAQKQMIQVVREKMNDPWAWERLGETLGNGDLDTHIGCLCRTLCCPNVKPEFAVNIHEKLGRQLQQRGMRAEAKHELNTAMAIREARGWPVSDTLRQACRDAAVDDVDVVKDNKNFYQQHARLADSLIYADIPWIFANISGKSNGDEAQKEQLYLAFKKQNEKTDKRISGNRSSHRGMSLDSVLGSGQINGRHKTDPSDPAVLESLTVKTMHHPELADLPLGSPVQIKITTVNGRSRILTAESREGTAWDQVPERVGIVDHVNTDKELTFVIFNENNASCCLHHNRFSMAADLAPGDFVSVKYLVKPIKSDTNKTEVGRFIVMRRLQTKTEYKLQPVDVTITTTPPTGSFYETYHGPINICQGGRFGFVEDVFIPGHLISAEVQFADIVTGITIYKWNRKKGRPTWSALTLKKASNSQDKE